MADIRYKIKEFLFDTMFIECHDDTMLFDDGLMDSMGFLSLISYIEDNYGIKLRDDQLTESNFQNVNSIVNFIHENTTTRSAP